MTKWLGVGVFLLAGACFAQSPTLDKIRKTGTVTLGYIDGGMPFSYAVDGKPVGYSVDLCERVAGDLRKSLKLPKLETKWVALTLQNRLEAVRKGQVDLECSTTSRTLSRQATVDFSLMTFADGAGVLVRSDSTHRRLGDLGGKRIAVITGTTTERGLAQTLERTRVDAQVVKVATRAEGVEMLDKGLVDGLASDRMTLFGVAIASANPGAYRLFEEIHSIETYAFAMRRGDSDFRLAVDRSIAGLYRDGGIGEIYGKWFGPLGAPWKLLEAMYILQAIPE
jgi:ABC-type amino acid transport substrate-binding protein